MIRRARHLARWSLLLTLLTTALSAAAFDLQGELLDAESGAPIAEVAVLLPGTDLEVLSDGEGRFTLPDLPDTPFNIVLSHLAYEARVILVDPGELAGEPLVLDLTPTYYRGEKVVVTASRYGPEIHLTSSNITREEIHATAGAKDLPLLLEATPGLHAASDAGNGVGYTYLKLRGFDQKRIGVMVNGIPLNDPEDHQVYWVDLPDLASSLEDIQVQRGVSNSLGGMSAIGGSVNFVTRQLADQPGGELKLATGSFGTAKQSLGWQSGLLGGRFATALRVSHLESDGYRDRSGSDQWSAFWSGRLIGERSATQLNIYTGRERSQQAWYGIGEQQLIENRRHNPESYANAIDDFRQPHYELHHRWNLRDNLVMKNSLFLVHGEGFYENFKADRNAADFGLDRALGLADSVEVDLIRRKNVKKDQYGIVSKVTWKKGPSRLIAGGDWYDFHSEHRGDLLSVEGFDSEEILGLPDYYGYTGDKRAWSLYLNEQLELGLGFTALADLHYQHKSYDFLQTLTGNFRGPNRHGYGVDYNFFNPKGGLFWNSPGEPFGGELGLYAHYGVAHREPADSELFDTWLGPDDLGVSPLFASGNPFYQGGELQYIYWSDPLVKEEKVKNYELGLSWRGRALSFAANGYLMEFENEIVSYGAVSEDGAGIRGNADLTLHRGLEIAATVLLSELEVFEKLSGRHELKLAFSRSWDKFERFTTYGWDGSPENLSGNPIAGFPEHLGNLSLNSDYGPLATSLRLRSVGRQYLDNSGLEERSIEGHQVVDVSLTLHPAKLGLESFTGARVELKLYNALDVEYASSGYYDAWGDGNTVIPAAKSHFLLGVGYEF
jgi:iron complex outermembrane recepter protein